MRAITGKQRCYTVIGGHQTLSERAFTFAESELTCSAIGAILPVVRNAWDQKYLLEMIERHDTSPVRLERGIYNICINIITGIIITVSLFFLVFFAGYNEVFSWNKIFCWKLDMGR